MIKKLKLLETLFLPEWNTTAHITENGEIYIQLLKGRFITKDEIRTQFGTGWNEKFYTDREKIFDELYEYYIENYK